VSVWGRGGEGGGEQGGKGRESAALEDVRGNSTHVMCMQSACGGHRGKGWKLLTCEQLYTALGGAKTVEVHPPRLCLPLSLTPACPKPGKHLLPIPAHPLLL
jgi:hypothetical protein